MAFDQWRKRLAGEKVAAFLQPDALDEGYYRKPITEAKLGPNGKTNGQRRVIDYVPVAYFMDGNRLVGIIGDRDMRPEEVTDETLWSYVVSNPIPYEWFKAVVEEGQPWPDADKWTSPVPARMSDNQPAEPVEEVAPAEDAKPDEPPKPRHEVLAAAIKAEIAAAPKKVETLEQANESAGVKNKIAELRLTASREGEAIYKPVYAEYKRLYGIWNPMVDLAEAEEKAISKRVLSFREVERKKAEAAATEAARLQQEQDAANERAAQRAIARGEPEEMPLPAVEAAPVAPPAPAPVQPTFGTRKIKEDLKPHIQAVTNWNELFQYFKDTKDVKVLLLSLATGAIRAGRTVPGVDVQDSLVARDIEELLK